MYRGNNPITPPEKTAPVIPNTLRPQFFNLDVNASVEGYITRRSQTEHTSHYPLETLWFGQSVICFRWVIKKRMSEAPFRKLTINMTSAFDSVEKVMKIWSSREMDPVICSANERNKVECEEEGKIFPFQIETKSHQLYSQGTKWGPRSVSRFINLLNSPPRAKCEMEYLFSHTPVFNFRFMSVKIHQGGKIHFRFCFPSPLQQTLARTRKLESYRLNDARDRDRVRFPGLETNFQRREASASKKSLPWIVNLDPHQNSKHKTLLDVRS